MDSLRRIAAGPLIAAACVAGLWLMGSAPDALAPVPDLTGRPVETARLAARADGYHTQVIERPGPGRAGTVMSQHPKPGVHLAKGARIDLHVTRGTRQVVIPDTRGMPVDEALRVLRQAGVSPGEVTYRTVEGAEANRVISTEPRQGATVDAGSTVVVVAAA